MIHRFPYPDFEPVEVPERNLIAVRRPAGRNAEPDPEAVLRSALSSPLGTDRLRFLAKGKKRALILVDDATRATPAHLMAPLVVEELISAGMREEQIVFLGAVGSHRNMTAEERIRKLGAEVVERFEVLDHAWNNGEALFPLGTTEDGLEIVVNRLVEEADLLVGLGQVSPHRAAGFSGGSKIVLPGICGEGTVGQMHWFSILHPAEQVFGVRDNPVRERMDDVASAVGLDFILNAVLDQEGRLVEAVAGDFVAAHTRAARLSLEVNVVYLPRRADIVIADSRPGDRDFWQAGKALSACMFCVRRGGTIILATPCPEGISAEHPEVEEHGYVCVEEVVQQVANGHFRDLTAATHICGASRVLEHAHCVVVSPGIGPDRGARAKLPVGLSAQQALWEAFRRHGEDASVAILEHAADTFPIAEKA